MTGFVRETTKKGAPSCGLYIKIRQTGKSFTLLENLKKICFGVNASKYEKNMHVFEYTGKITKTDEKEYIAALKDYLQAQGMIFILREGIEIAAEIKADGVIVKTFAESKKAREILGDEAIIGIRLAASRKKIIEALDKDIDFISIPITAKNNSLVMDLLHYWSVRTDKPCLIEGNISNNECKSLVLSGASFIDGSNYILKHPSGALQAVINMLYAIDVAIPSETKH